MSVWAWFLVASAAAGLILVVAGLIQIVRSALRTADRFTSLLDTPAAAEIDSLSIESARFGSMAQDFESIAARLRIALDSMHESLEQLKMPEARATIDELRAEFCELRRSLG